MAQAIKNDCTTRKAQANRKAYLAERDRKDRILLRLDKGEAGLLDAACAAAGLCRSEFFRRHLLPLAGGPAPHATSAVAAPPESVASEFDDLFQPGR
jgi:hypothetical protein